MNFNIPKLNIPSVDAPEVNIPNIHMPELPQKMEPIQNYTPKSVLVLGNGFDIDLGISNVQKITSAEKLRSRAFDEIVPFRKFIIKDDTSALL